MNGERMTRLVLGTRNPHKLAELRELLRDLPIPLLDLSQFPLAPQVEETGSTFHENATIKAITLARALGEWVLAEDSGLVVPALGGEPGVHSAVYAGRHGDDAANNALLLERIAQVPDEKREAFYVCVAVLADPLGTVRAQTEGHCHGRIAKQARGQHGFGYDPLFEIPEYHRTFGELSPLAKRVLSHRARAVEKLLPHLRRFLDTTAP
ncbi:MAG: RdgB/HAM1 family non-canonical purine NTP pyrophosphatase [Gemmatales bacterium]|nr:RdgB/HAM1 family non-canonical purine NTP pyrophosphatase [Gemmatales bacterium]MDW7995600.1 RdgB/HAM1 family non-canonical purine NTP pyrophosphatase [Gemmatales bacterium]